MAAAARQAERERRDRDRREAEGASWRSARDQEEARRREAEYRRAIAQGGDAAAEVRWHRRYSEVLEETESRLALCQWPLANEQPGGCTRRTANVFCGVHSRQIDREAEKRKRDAEPER